MTIEEQLDGALVCMMLYFAWGPNPHGPDTWLDRALRHYACYACRLAAGAWDWGI